MEIFGTDQRGAARIVAAQSYAETILADNPVAYFRFEETTGTVAADSSLAGNDHSATLVGGFDLNQPSVRKETGVAPRFDGINGRVAIADDSDFDMGTGNYAFELWFNPSDTARGDLITYKGAGSDFGLFWQNSKVRLFHGGQIVVETAETHSINARHHVVVTRTDVDTVTMYVDGVAATGISSGSLNINGGIAIGSNHNGDPTTTASHLFDGLIDEVAIYSVGLAADDVMRHYSAGLPRVDIGAVEYAPIDLLATSFDAATDHVQSGQTDVTFTVENIRTIASGSFVTHVVWSPNDVVGDFDDVVVQGTTESFVGLAGGASATRTLRVQLDRAALYAQSVAADPAGQPVGYESQDTSHLFVVIDVNNDVVESDEANNAARGLGVDFDDITYFPWDTDGNGTVTPKEALAAIQAVNSDDATHDFDGNGIVTPLEALATLQRIGHVRNDVPTVSLQSLASVTPSPRANVRISASPSTVWAYPINSDEDTRLFSAENAEDTLPLSVLPDTDEAVNATDHHFATTTDWLSVV